MNICPSKVCEICKAPSKYCCPRCSMRTCSLGCVKAHKASTGCNGVRDKTAFVPLGKFDRSHLLSDYRFLEETWRVVDEAQRGERNFGWRTYLPQYLTKLKHAARQRKTDLRIMPAAFSKRKSNTTVWHYRENRILWRVEWMFPDADLTLVDDRLDESMTINKCLDKYLIPALSEVDVQCKLAYYQSAGHKGVAVIMRKERDSPEKYFQLDKNKSLKSNFAGKTIVEYPVLYVVLLSSLPCYNLIEKEPQIKTEKELDPVEEIQTSGIAAVASDQDNVIQAQDIPP